MPRVLVIVPAYNEAATIADVLDALHTHVPAYDVLVVDDGSTDATASAVRKSGRAALVSMPLNVGIGGAMQTGYKYAVRNGYDIAVQCDADGQHPVEEIPRLVERLEDGTADVIIGSRYVADTDYRPSWSRRVGKSLLSRLVDAMIGGGITDTTSGFRAANRHAFRLFARHYPDDYPEAEALVILHRAGLKAAEIPVNMKPRQGGQTSIRPPHAFYYMVKVALAIFIDMFRRYTNAGDET
jgi:hypothetical protein